LFDYDLEYQEVKCIIHDLHNQLRDSSNFSTIPVKNFEPLFRTLDNLARLLAGDHLIKLLTEDPEIISILPVIRKFYSNYLFYQEINLAQDILSSSDPWHTLYSYSLFPRYQQLVYHQGKEADLAEGGVVAFIGGGAVPLTLILLHILFGVTGMSIEVQPEIAYISQKVIEKLDVSEGVKIISGDETTLKGKKVSAIMVAALAQPKKRIFQYLRTILDKNTHVSVSYRTYTGMRTLLYNPVMESDLEGFEEIKRIFPQDPVNNTICFIRKAY